MISHTRAMVRVQLLVAPHPGGKAAIDDLAARFFPEMTIVLDRAGDPIGVRIFEIYGVLPSGNDSIEKATIDALCE